MQKINKFKITFSQTKLLVGLLVLLVIGISLYSPAFIRPNNLRNILLQISVAGILTAGMSMVMISGGIDLSIGSLVSFGGCLLAVLLKGGMPALPAALIAIAVVTACSTATGAVIAFTKTQPFIITLGTMSIYKAFALIVSDGADVPAGSFDWTSKTFLGLPMPIIILIVVFVLMGLLMKFTRFGRTCYQIGSNEAAAFISGVSVTKRKIGIYALNGLLVGFTSVMLLSRLGSAMPLMGDGLEMRAIAACAIGGIALTGGVGNVLSSFLGLLFLGVVQNGLNIVGVPAFYQYLVNGAIIVIAVVFSTYNRKK